MRRVTKKLRDEIRYLYNIKGWTITEISNEYDIPEWKVDEVLGRL